MRLLLLLLAHLQLGAAIAIVASARLAAVLLALRLALWVGGLVC